MLAKGKGAERSLTPGNVVVDEGEMREIQLGML